jgi:hypothetical protein
MPKRQKHRNAVEQEDQRESRKLGHHWHHHLPLATCSLAVLHYQTEEQTEGRKDSTFFFFFFFLVLALRQGTFGRREDRERIKLLTNDGKDNTLLEKSHYF